MFAWRAHSENPRGCAKSVAPPFNAAAIPHFAPPFVPQQRYFCGMMFFIMRRIASGTSP